MTMATIQTKNVPDDVHQILKQRAAADGMSLQEYVLSVLTDLARHPTLNEILDRAGERAQGTVDRDFIVEALHEERENR